MESSRRYAKQGSSMSFIRMKAMAGRPENQIDFYGQLKNFWRFLGRVGWKQVPGATAELPVFGKSLPA
jgi:hypothetical protein